MIDPRQRFTTRVGNYTKFRPGYPSEILDLLNAECGLRHDWRVADIGSGTGILSELFLKNGNTVYGVEPNRAMREAAEQNLKGSPNFVSIDGAAESTTLGDKSVDLVSAGQAFHWFDPEKTKAEFARILRPGGWVALIWNERRTEAAPLFEAYENLLREFAPEFEKIRSRRINTEILADFFGSAGYREKHLDNHQDLDFEGLSGRLLSSSYAPEAGNPRHEPMMARLREIFEQNQKNGIVRMEYDTRIYIGKIPGIARGLTCSS